MTTQQIILIIIVAAAIVLFVWGHWRYDIVAVAALLAVTLTGLVPADKAFTQFGHPAVVTVGAVFVLARALMYAGTVDVVARFLARVGNHPNIQLILLTFLTAFLAAFIHNTGAIAVVMPIAAWLARRGNYSPSRLLMPLAFGSHLGGMTTLIGTPPNLITSSFRAQATGQPFRMFDFAPLGLGVALAGIVVIIAFAGKLLPHRKGQPEPKDLFQIEQYLSELKITPDSKLAGKALGSVRGAVDESSDLTVVGLIRGGKTQLPPSPFEVLYPGDLILVEANSEVLKELVDSTGVELAKSKEDDQGRLLPPEDIGVVEAVVTYNSRLRNATVQELDLRGRYGLNLVAVARHGSRLKRRLSQIRFETGDILLLQGKQETLAETLNTLGCLPLAERGLQVGKPRRIILAAGIFAAAIVAVTVDIMPVQIALVAAAMAMVLLRIITLREAYDSIEWQVLILIGALLAVSQAVESTGTADLVGAQVARIAHIGGPPAAIAALLVATTILTNVIHNSPAAVLMCPVGVSIAHALHASVDPFLMAITIGASNAFLTPFGHQSNALVLDPGGYRFSDYLRLGFPVTVAVSAAAVPLILLLWPP